MARFDAFSDSQLQALLPSAERLLSLSGDTLRTALGGVPNLEIGEAVAIWMLSDDAVLQPQKQLHELAVSTHRWFHLIRDRTGDKFIGSAVSVEPHDGSPAQVVSVSPSLDQADAFAAAAEFIRTHEPAPDYLARYLIVPGFQTRVIWLEAQVPIDSDQQNLIVICDAPPATHFQLRRYYSDRDFRAILSDDRSITGLRAQ